MHFLRITHNKKNKNGFALCIVLFLLVIYLVGTVEISSFHALLHNAENQTELHSVDNEANGCHQSVYHNKKDLGCEHKTHIIANKKCDLCHLSLESFHFASIKPADYFTISLELPEAKAEAAIIGRSFSLLLTRAPPIV
ncbi:MAG TPA: hypothetical protein PKN99_00655 [Cyclobacteriaceae bacterium]|nr:hypothetical protein [Cyclobacteriaceae bacterium]HRK55745.1 hypothetical protein [Cyclobacteriaceae bacterium]